MARKSISELLAGLLVAFPDNNAKLITAAILREYFTDLLNAIRPAYAILDRTAGVAQNVTVAPAPLVFTAANVAPGNGEYTANAALGRITRVDPGTTRFTFTADMLPGSATARTVTFTLYKNGVATNWRQSITTQSATQVESISFSSIEYLNAAANYDMYVQIDTATSYTFSNMTLVAEAVPVNNYV